MIALEYGATGFPIVWAYLAGAAGFLCYGIYAMVLYVLEEIQLRRDEATLAELDELDSGSGYG